MNYNEHDLAAATKYMLSLPDRSEFESVHVMDAYIAGLTAGRAADRRERAMFAVAQGLLAKGDYADEEIPLLSRDARHYADSILAELDRTSAPAKSDAESRCKQWESMYGPILDFLQSHPEIVGAEMPGSNLNEKLLVFLKSQIGKPASAWQPISTAPLNQSVLIFLPNWDHYGPAIYRAIHVDMGTGKHWHTTAWACGRDLVDLEPIAWQPLPKPPEA